MMVRKTIAGIGTVEGEALILLEALARQKLRLLYVSGQQEANHQAKEHQEMALCAAEIEIISSDASAAVKRIFENTGYDIKT